MKPQAARSVTIGSSSYAAVSSGQHRISSAPSQQVPDRKVAPLPGDTGSFRARSSVAGSRIYPTRLCSCAVPNPDGSADSGYASLVLIIADMMCKLLSEFQVPLTQRLLALVQAIVPFYMSSAIAVPH